MFKDASGGTLKGSDSVVGMTVYSGCDRWGFRWWVRIGVCLRWGHWVQSPGVPTGYGPSRHIDRDRIMSDILHLRVVESAEVPAVPIHLFIEVCHGDIQVLNISTHDLAWSAVWIPETFVPTHQSFSMESCVAVVRSSFM